MLSLPIICASNFSAVIFLCTFFHIQSILAERNADGSRRGSSSSNLKDALLIYPTGIRSERDLPVCPGWVVEEESKSEVGPSHAPASISGGNDLNKLQQPGSTRNPSDMSKKVESDPSKYLSACNIIHKRYFYPPMVERLCRCPDRTECPMEWSTPPKYKDLSRSSSKNERQQGSSKQTVSTTPSSKQEKMSFDPYSVMVSSRTQLKFCTEVKPILPFCERSRKHKDSVSDEYPAMVRTIKKTLLSPDLQSISINCYCPPLFHGWSYHSKNVPLENGNVTATADTSDANYFYRCDKLRKCKTSQQCGTVRTDYHFSYYHCACPKKHICVPKVYPPISHEDVIEEAEEALYSGQVAAAFCTPE